MVDFSRAGKAIRALWDDTCTITHKVSRINEITKRTEQVDEVLYSDIACRISTKHQIPSVSDSGYVSAVTQTIKLFIAPEVIIPAGSKIVVTHKGITTEYKQSGQPARYTNHQEITLELSQEYA